MAMLMIAFITDMIAFAVANGLNVYYWKEVVGNSSYTSLVTFGGLVAGLPFVLMIPQLCKKFGKGAVSVSYTHLQLTQWRKTLNKDRPQERDENGGYRYCNIQTILMFSFGKERINI